MLEIHWEEIVLDLSDLFLKFDYDNYTYESVLVKSEKDYDVFKRVLVESHISTVGNLEIDQPTNSYGKEIADNIDENIEQNTIYNNDVINIVFKNNMIKLFKNDDDKIYSVEILSNKLTVEAFYGMINHVKYLIKSDRTHFDDYVDLMIVFSPVRDK